MPSCFAIAFARSTSYPRGWSTLLPRSVYCAKPTAESPNATVNSPGFFVGADAGAADAAAAVARIAQSATRTSRFFTTTPFGTDRNEANLARRHAEGKRLPKRLAPAAVPPGHGSRFSAAARHDSACA